MSVSIRSISIAVVLRLFAASVLHAEDGYRLWLRCDPLPAEKAGGYHRRSLPHDHPQVR